MFHLKAADGAIGAYLQSVRDAYRDFRAPAEVIGIRAHIVCAFRALADLAFLFYLRRRGRQERTERHVCRCLRLSLRQAAL